MAMRPKFSAAFLPILRSENSASAALTGRPSEKVASPRMVTRHLVRVASGRHAVARRGLVEPSAPGTVRTS